jgi:hypothetical protein
MIVQKTEGAAAAFETKYKRAVRGDDCSSVFTICKLILYDKEPTLAVRVSCQPIIDDDEIQCSVNTFRQNLLFSTRIHPSDQMIRFVFTDIRWRMKHAFGYGYFC